jgi:hypothetical protein
MGRFILDENPVFSYFGTPDRIIKYDIRNCPKFYLEAINRTCARHTAIPASIIALGNRESDPWKRTLVINDECIRQKINLSLNVTTVRQEFRDKVYSTIFEMVCLEMWPKAIEVPYNPQNPNASDALLADNRNRVRAIDWKAKDRNEPPAPYFDVTIPASQMNQAAELYCCGQTKEPYDEGYILGVISKKDFFQPVTRKALFYPKGSVAPNGIVWKADTYACLIRDLWTWRLSDNGSFFTDKYYAAAAMGRV